LEEGAELLDGLVLVQAEVIDDDHVGASPVGTGKLIAADGWRDQERVVGDLDVIAHVVPGDAGRHQADRGRVAVVELQVVEHASPSAGS
jgi:hypothetical protein